MRQTAPSQRMVDFTRKKLSYDLPATSYSPGLVSSPLHFWMPSFLSERLSKGFQLFGKSSRGFLTNEAVMIAVETRTSSPVRIVRDKDTLQHLTVEGLFPCGEGAGYAGGIVSAAMDGERCAELRLLTSELEIHSQGHGEVARADMPVEVVVMVFAVVTSGNVEQADVRIPFQVEVLEAMPQPTRSPASKRL